MADWHVETQHDLTEIGVVWGSADKSSPDQEGNELQQPNSGFIQHTPYEAQYTS